MHRPALSPLRCCVVGLALASAPGLGAAEPAWRMLEAPRFTVFSQLPDARTRAWAEEFNEFIEELRHQFVAKDAELPPLRVVIFARDRDFTPYKPLRTDGKGPQSWVAGYFSRRDSWGIVGLAGADTTEDTRRLIFHEGVHWYMSAIPRKFPVWLEEGVAEVFSTFKQSKGKVQWGIAIPGHVELLQQKELIPLSRFLFLDRSDPLFNEDDRTGLFYAEAWFFVHYLLYAERKGARSALDDYLRGLQRGSAPEAAFRAAFGGDYGDVENDLRRHLRGGKFFIPSRPESAPALADRAVVPAPAHLVAAARARLAASSRRHDVAAAHVTQAIALAPDQPAGYEAQGVLAYDLKQYDKARAACETAEKLGSADAGTLFLLAYLRGKEEADRGGLWGQPARDIAHLYHRVIQLCPSMEPAYKNLAALVSGLDTMEEADLACLKQGVERFPQSGEIILGIAQILGKHGDRDQARTWLAAARARGLSGDYERVATGLEERWDFDAYMPRIEASVRENDFAAAIALYDELIPRISNVQTRGGLIRARQVLAARQKIQDAETATREGQLDRARDLYNEALASGVLTTPQRRTVEDRLSRLPAPPASTPAPAP